ncbi:hypothetical protein IMG5_194720 [Ichthyophthirius multifiliis]|uniref:Transmembrane protein n=1 Tax=Ichthyophthirius multifiliis TaxID=5932 RepID=G0R4T5_ICHMU|nr:hypothetical protein IMG5_194720 [Ichthyophthirius multifiliis]EGR27523.1 hypothetical protein IMG5_194720 [Ichthyophthirius multifiliis]|eukprot:XP_004024975.1 hypothetical protein IMG5_194720 [Ichthyophthirius multifiliis]
MSDFQKFPFTHFTKIKMNDFKRFQNECNFNYNQFGIQKGSILCKMKRHKKRKKKKRTRSSQVFLCSSFYTLSFHTFGSCQWLYLFFFFVLNQLVGLLQEIEIDFIRSQKQVSPSYSCFQFTSISVFKHLCAHYWFKENNTYILFDSPKKKQLLIYWFTLNSLDNSQSRCIFTKSSVLNKQFLYIFQSLLTIIQSSCYLFLLQIGKQFDLI